MMDTQSKDIDAIRRLYDQWNDGWHSGNAEALLSLYADDPGLMPQNSPAIMGREAIRSIYSALFKAYTVQGEGRLVEVELSGDLGYFRIEYTIKATPIAGGQMIQDEGKSLFIVRRQPDSSWKIVRLIDNSNREQTGRE